MQVQKPKKGYKLVKSLFGKYEEIPEDWRYKQLEEVGEIMGGGTPDSMNKEYWNGEILWAVPTDITKLNSNFLDNTERKISEKGLNKSSAKLLPVGSVLITSRATIGECAINKKPMATNQGFQSLICNEGNDNLFWFYAIKYHKKRLFRLSYGTTFLEISKNAIKKVSIPAPSKHEQQKIASILSNVDSLIQQTQKEIEQTQRLKKGLMQRLLTKGIGHKKFKKVKSLFGKYEEIPEEWEIKTIKDSDVEIIDGDRGNEYPKESDFFDSGFCLFLSTKNVTKNGFIFEECQFLTKEKDEKLRKGNLSRKDIVITTRGTIGNVAFFDESIPYENIRINSGMAILQNKNETIDQKFLYLFLKSYFIYKQLESIKYGSAQPQLTIGTINSLKIILPQKFEQQKIASILSNVDSQIQKQQEYKTKLESLKKGLMQKLLTGQIRVRV